MWARVYCKSPDRRNGIAEVRSRRRMPSYNRRVYLARPKGGASQRPCMRSLGVLFRNPILDWLRWLVGKARLVASNRGHNLRIGYMSVARRSKFGTHVTLYEFVELESVRIGDMSYVSRGARIAHADIGKFCCIGPESLLGLGQHPTRTFVSVHPAFYSTRRQSPLAFVTEDKFSEVRRIQVGNDVWIGARAVIMDGVSVGDGAIIAASAVVSHDVPPYAVVAGVPARVLRYRFDATQVERLLASQWWNKPSGWLAEHAGEFTDIVKFLSAGSASTSTPTVEQSFSSKGDR